MSDVEAIQKRPGMYIGDTRDGTGLHNTVLAVVSNSAAEVLAGYATGIEIVLNPDRSCTVADNGRGIPLDPTPDGHASCLEVIMTRLASRWKDPGREGTIDEVRYVGVATVNALSDWLEARIFRHGDEYVMKFELGRPREALATVGKAPVVGGKPITGTHITFRPSEKFFDPVDFDVSTLEGRLRDLRSDQGVTITLTDRRHA